MKPIPFLDYKRFQIRMGEDQKGRKVWMIIDMKANMKVILTYYREIEAIHEARKLNNEEGVKIHDP